MVIVAASVVFAFARLRTHNITPIEPQTVTLEGETTCMPHKNPDQPHTLECMIGLQATDGKYYSLQNTEPSLYDTQRHVKVTGELQADPDSPYQSSGNLNVDEWEFTDLNSPE